MNEGPWTIEVPVRVGGARLVIGSRLGRDGRETPHEDDQPRDHEQHGPTDRDLVEPAGARPHLTSDRAPRSGPHDRLASCASPVRSTPEERERVGEEERRAERGDELEQDVVVEVHVLMLRRAHEPEQIRRRV